MKRILIFPHMSLFFGNLFEKKYMIPSSDQFEFIFMENSPLTFGVNQYEGLQDYEYRNLRYEMARIKNYDKFLILIQSIKHYFVEHFFLVNFRLWLKVFIYILKVNFCKKIIKQLNVDLVVIGYDVLFPYFLSEAIEKLAIPTVSIMERPIHCMAQIYSIRCENYFIGGQREREHLIENPLNSIKNYFPIGLIRTDLIKVEERIDENLIVVFDFHSAEKPLVGLNSWKNNLLFYNEVLFLAQNFPTYNFVIRGKNCKWTELEYFNKILEKINNQNNIEINQDISLNVSYSLLSRSNKVIARHTSIADEAIASGKSVLFVDYYHGNSFHIKNLFGYNEMAFVAHDRLSLISNFKKMISDEYGEYLDKEKIQDYFGIFDGRCHERYSQKVRELLNIR